MADCSKKSNPRRIKLVGFISFFLGFSQALLAYVMSSYLKESLQTENVGLGYFFGYACALLALLNFHKIIGRFGKGNAFIFTLLGKIVILAFLVTLTPSIWGVVLLVGYIILGTLNWASLDVILESFSVDRRTGRIRGFQLMLIDAGFILGPLVSTQILEQLDFSFIFLTVFCVDVLAVLLAAKGLRGINHDFHIQLNVSDLLMKIGKRKNILRIYYISFVLDFFYAVMVIYTPLYLRSLGISWENIGLIFTFMLLPFIILPIPVGFLADRKFGEKEMLIAAILITGFFVSVIYFINHPSVWIWGGILFLTRVGASMIQTLRDSYFYKRINGQDVDVIYFYRTSIPVGYIAASAATTVFLLFFPLQALFLFLALVVFSALYPAFRIADSHVFSETEYV